MTTRLCVAPEDVMALLDGELTGADARTIEAHLEECSQCALLAEQLRDTSASLAQWSVPAMPGAVEDFVEERAEREALRLRKRTGVMRLPTWRLATAGALATVLGVVAIVMMSSVGHYRRARMLRSTNAVMVSPAQQAPEPVPLSEERIRARRSEPLKARSSSHMLAVDSNGVMESKDGVPDASYTPGSPMIARVASLTLVIKDVDAARSALDAIVARHHGFSARMNVSAPEYGPHSVNAALRVPAPELAAATAEIERLGRVANESQTGEEVSQEHADLVARLKTARETETRFQAILQQRTGKVSDVLEVEQNIARVRGDIEAMEAEQKGLERRVDFATIDVVLTQEYTAPLAPQADSMSTQLHNALVAGYRNTTGMLLGLVLFAMEFGPPLLMSLLILATPAYLIWRRYERLRRKA
jgi:hypothetical protein